MGWGLPNFIISVVITFDSKLNEMALCLPNFWGWGRGAPTMSVARPRRYIYIYIYIYIYTAGGQKFGLLALKGKNETLSP